jgi:hypothetical protein
MIDLVVYLILVLFIFYLVLENIKTKRKFGKAVATLFQLYIDKNISDNLAKEKLEELSVEDKNNKISQDDFIKFLTQSRQWAFDYIEQVQSAIQDFKESTGPSLEYFREYGAVMQLPTDQLFSQIIPAYDKLVDMLPKDNEENEIQK